MKKGDVDTGREMGSVCRRLITMRCMCCISRKNTADDRLKVTGHPPFMEHGSGMPSHRISSQIRQIGIA